MKKDQWFLMLPYGSKETASEMAAELKENYPGLVVFLLAPETEDVTDADVLGRLA